MRARRAEWLILIVVFPVFAWGGDESAQQVRRWLDRVAESSQRQSYQGTFVYRCERQLTAMKVVHAADPNGAREKLVALNGPLQEVIQNDDASPVMTRGGQRVSGMRQGVSALMVRPENLVGAVNEHYRVVKHGVDRVAGRETDLVVIMPKDEFRHGFHLWLDKDTGVVLRSDMIDFGGAVIEQVMFTDIEFLEQARANELLGAAAVAKAESAPEAAHEGMVAGNSVWRIGKLPDGFAIAEHFVRPRHDGHPAQEQFVLTDGLASVSVFVESAEAGHQPFIGSSRMGAVNAFGHVIKGHHVTVVGEVPFATVKMIGESLEQAQ